MLQMVRQFATEASAESGRLRTCSPSSLQRESLAQADAEVLRPEVQSSETEPRSGLCKNSTCCS